MTFKLKIMYRAIKIRLQNGELIEDIMLSYPKLSKSEKQILLDELKKENLIPKTFKLNDGFVDEIVL